MKAIRRLVEAVRGNRVYQLQHRLPEDRVIVAAFRIAMNGCRL
jgi:hypothetical protein